MPLYPPTTTSPGYLAVTSKTATYSIVNSDDLILVDSSGGAFTVTLPTAVGITGKIFRIKKIDGSTAFAVTIATTSSQTIDGATSRLLTSLSEEVEVVSDGSNYRVLNHKTATDWISYAPTFTGFGTPTNVEAFWRRSGTDIELQVKFTTGTTTATEARISYPSGYTSASTTYITSIRACGKYTYNNTAGNSVKQGVVLSEPSVGYVTFALDDYTSAIGPFSKQNASTLFGTGVTTNLYNIKVPMTDWWG